MESIRRIKARNGPDLVVPGSASLIATLLEHGLADEVVLLVNPIALGKGKRFFEGGTLPRGFALGSSQAVPAGILVNVYKLIPTLAEEAVSRAKLDREMEIAREVQERLFPQTVPNVPGVEMAAQCRPAHAVGGDYYDLIAIRDGSLAEAKHARGCDRLGIAIGDISGKGVSAALLMASLHASLRGQTLSGVGDLGTKMANVNRLLYDASELQPLCHVPLRRTGTATRARCTTLMVDTILLRRCAKSTAIGKYFAWETVARSFGLLAGAPYKQQMLHLIPGDILLAFTDGISEAMNAAEDEWGEDRMIAEAQAHADGNAAELLQRLFRAADTFAAGAPQHDDMTLVVLRISV